MITKLLERFYPGSQLVEVHQTGASAVLKTGVLVLIGQREDGSLFGELDGQHCFDLEFEGKTLTGFDGGFFLPREICQLLTELGYTAPEAEFCSLSVTAAPFQWDGAPVAAMCRYT